MAPAAASARGLCGILGRIERMREGPADPASVYFYFIVALVFIGVIAAAA